MLRRLAFAAAAAAVLASVAAAEEWPGWRGPRRDGTSLETDLPLRWGPAENVAWKAPIPGKGHASPIVWGDRVFVTTALRDEGKRMLLCLDARDGKVLWDRVVVTAPLEKINDLNSYASGTPVTDGRRVWVAFQNDKVMQVACYDFEGNQVWSKSPGPFSAQHGFCSSPALYKDLVILNGDQDGDAYIVALDQATGEERWRADRPNKVRSYCPPVIFHLAGKDQLVLSGSKCVASYDPATGKPFWIVDGPTDQFVASLVHADGVLMVTGGYPEHHILGIRPDGEGNVTKTHILWHHTKGVAYVPSPIAWGKYFYLVADDGTASCIEAGTGERPWMERLGKHHSASPVAAAGYLYFLDDTGRTHVVKAAPRFEVVGTNDLGEECRASPAISRGRIFIRALGHLYCIGSAAPAH